MATTANVSDRAFLAEYQVQTKYGVVAIQNITASGININGISSILTAISNYKTKVQKACDISAKKSLIESAIKGSSSEAKLKQFTTSIQTSMVNHIKQMNDYEKILNDVKASYKQNDANNASFNIKVDSTK